VSTNRYSQCVGNGVRSTWATITFLGEQRVTIDPQAAIIVAEQMTENAKVLSDSSRSTNYRVMPPAVEELLASPAVPP
jgi:hypothetical protein